MNLAVMRLDEKGKPVGRLLYFRTGKDDENLPRNTYANIECIHIVKGRRIEDESKLVISQWYYLNSNPPVSYRNVISVYSLDSHGVPIESTRKTSEIVPNNEGYITTITNHNSNPNLLYMSGQTRQTVYVVRIDSTNELSVLQPAIRSDFESVRYQLSVNSTNTKLYMTSNKVIEINTLSNGLLELPTGPNDPDRDKKYIRKRIPDGSVVNRFLNTNAFLLFHLTTNALYLRPLDLDALGKYRAAGFPREYPLMVWPLDNEGLLVGEEPLVFLDTAGRAMAVDVSDDIIWLAIDDKKHDAYNQEEEVVDGFSAQAFRLVRSTGPNTNFDLHFLHGSPVRYRQKADMADIATNTGTLVLLTGKLDIKSGANQVKDWYLKVKVLEATVRREGESSGENLTTFNLKFWGVPRPTIVDPIKKNCISEISNPTLIDTLTIDPGNELSSISKSFSLEPYLRNFYEEHRIPGQAASIICRHDATEQLFFRLQIESTDPTIESYERFKVQLLIYTDGNPDINPSLIPLRGSDAPIETVLGEYVAFLLPGYGFFDELGKRTEAFELMSEHSKKYLEAAIDAATNAREKIVSSKRPENFIISCFSLNGGQGHIGQLENQSRAMGLLGFNTASTEYWNDIPPEKGGIPSETIGITLKNSGLKWHSAATNLHSPMIPISPNIDYPWTYFDFFLRRIPDIQNWAKKMVEYVKGAGGRLAEVVSYQITDEPSWLYGNAPLTVLPPPPQTPLVDYQIDFETFLTENGQSFGNGVKPVFGVRATDDLNIRKLFYWSMRFFVESSAKGHGLAAAALEEALGPSQKRRNMHVDFNNFINYWHRNAMILNQNDVPGNGVGYFDWMLTGRLPNLIAPSTESGSGSDEFHQHWSVYSGTLRSAARLGNKEFHCYLKPGNFGEHPAGASYHILSVIGHGAKSIDLFKFGHLFLGGELNWSESFEQYRQIAEALYLVGSAEDLLFPGNPPVGRVALLFSGSSNLWDDIRGTEDATKAPIPLYVKELTFIHYALTHANYTIEFVDDHDIENGSLSSRGYSVLYITGPNVSAEAQQKIANWVVFNHGNIVLMPGAAVADQYNETTTILDTVSGLQTRGANNAIRMGENNETWNLHRTLEIVDLTNPIFGMVDKLFEPTVPLTHVQEGASSIRIENQDVRRIVKVIGSFKEGNNTESAGIVYSLYPAGGSSIAYGFYPGLQYRRAGPLDTTNDVTSRLPLCWDKSLRNLVVLPATMANTPHVFINISHETVEVCPLYSEKGIAIVLLNWTGQTISSYSFTMHVRFSSIISSSRGIPITTEILSPGPLGNLTKITLSSLEYVDVLLVRYPG